MRHRVLTALFRYSPLIHDRHSVAEDPRGDVARGARYHFPALEPDVCRFWDSSSGVLMMCCVTGDP